MVKFQSPPLLASVVLRITASLKWLQLLNISSHKRRYQDNSNCKHLTELIVWFYINFLRCFQVEFSVHGLIKVTTISTLVHTNNIDISYLWIIQIDAKFHNCPSHKKCQYNLVPFFVFEKLGQCLIQLCILCLPLLHCCIELCRFLHFPILILFWCL